MELNSVIISGNLVRDPELKWTPEQKAVCSFAIGHNKTRYADGEKDQEAHFFIVTCWDKTAELVAEHLKKGSGVVVEGSLRQDRWETQDGSKREKIKISARKVNFLPRKKDE